LAGISLFINSFRGLVQSLSLILPHQRQSRSPADVHATDAVHGLHNLSHNLSNPHLHAVVPDEIVVQVLGRHATELPDERLQQTVIRIEVIDVVHAVASFPAWHLVELEAFLLREATVCLLRVRADNRLGLNFPA